ncbi:hypothetical protein J6590_033489 [Homalodisca vitripennis]|nr:hypothetical protein J6590_033489 [Homalodisca vitripennis]
METFRNEVPNLRKSSLEIEKPHFNDSSWDLFRNNYTVPRIRWMLCVTDRKFVARAQIHPVYRSGPNHDSSSLIVTMGNTIKHLRRLALFYQHFMTHQIKAALSGCSCNNKEHEPSLCVGRCFWPISSRGGTGTDVVIRVGDLGEDLAGVDCRERLSVLLRVKEGMMKRKRVDTTENIQNTYFSLEPIRWR